MLSMVVELWVFLYLLRNGDTMTANTLAFPTLWLLV